MHEGEESLLMEEACSLPLKGILFPVVLALFCVAGYPSFSLSSFNPAQTNPIVKGLFIHCLQRWMCDYLRKHFITPSIRAHTTHFFSSPVKLFSRYSCIEAACPPSALLRYREELPVRQYVTVWFSFLLRVGLNISDLKQEPILWD